MSDLVQNARSYANSTGYMDGAGPEVRLWMHSLCDELERLTRELEDARKDAARWQRLKEMPSEANSDGDGDDSHIAVFVPIQAFELGDDPPELDAAIDATMEKARQRDALDRMARNADELGLDF